MRVAVCEPVRMVDDVGKRKVREKRAAFSSARWQLLVSQLGPELRRVGSLLSVVPGFPNALENQAFGVSSRVLANGPVPTVVVPGHADGDMPQWKLAGSRRQSDVAHQGTQSYYKSGCSLAATV